MNRKEASFILANIDRRVCDDELNEALDMAIKALEQMPVITTAGEGGVIYYPQVEGVTPTVIDAGKQEPCEDAISRAEAVRVASEYCHPANVAKELANLPPVNPTKTGHCKDCKYFEYDSVAKVDGIPLIVAHEICSRWGDGCKTKEDGYCFLYEPQERSGEE